MKRCGYQVCPAACGASQAVRGGATSSARPSISSALPPRLCTSISAPAASASGVPATAIGCLACGPVPPVTSRMVCVSCVGQHRTPVPPLARGSEWLQVVLDGSALWLQEGWQGQPLSQCLKRLVGGEARAVSGDLVEDAVRL